MPGIRRLVPYLVFFPAFAAYLVTAEPLISAGDSGEVTAAAFVLGIPHPPGYPLFCLVGKFCSLLPIGNVAYRLNLMSGLFMALMALFIYLTASCMAGRGEQDGWHIQLAPAALALAVAFSGVSWGQATSGDVYPLQLCLSAAAIYLLVRSRKAADVRSLYLASFVFGLSVAGHYAALLLAPGFTLFLFHEMQFMKWDLKKAMISVFFMAVGLSVFVYLVPRAYAGTPMNWGDPETWRSFLAHVSRASYGDLASFSLGSFVGGLSAKGGSGVLVLALLMGGLLTAGLAFKRFLKERFYVVMSYATMLCAAIYLARLARYGITADKLRYFARLLQDEAWVAMAAAALLGMVFLLVRDRWMFLMLGMHLLSILTISLYRVPSDAEHYLLPLLDKFFLLFFMVSGILASLGIMTGLRWLNDRGGGWLRASAAASFALIGVPVWFFARNYAPSDHSRYYYAYDYSVNMLGGMEQDAIFLAEGDNQCFLAAYQKFVEQRRPDIEVFEVTGNIFRPYGQARAVYISGARPIYSTQESEVDGFPESKLERAGLVNRFPYSYSGVKDPVPHYNMRFGGSEMASADFATRELIADYHYTLGWHALLSGRKKPALKEFDSALFYGRDQVWINFNIANVYRDQYHDQDGAIRLYTNAQKLLPGLPDIYLMKGACMYDKGDFAGAVKEFKVAAELEPGLGEAYQGLANSYANLGDRTQALAYWKAALQNSPAADSEFIKDKIKELGGAT